MAVTGVADTLLAESLERIAREIDITFDSLLPLPQDSRRRLVEAMLYAV